MKMPKVMFALLMLLLSSNVFAFSPTSISPPDTHEATANFALTERVADLYEATLILSFTIQNKIQTAEHVLDTFQFSSAYKSTSEKRYIKLSRYIHPGLEVPDIIYPFHIFL